MDVRHLGSVALLAIMAVAALFFFPAAHGSYSSTHGPITAARSLRLRAVLMFAIAAAASVVAAIVRALVALACCGFEAAAGLQSSSGFVAVPLRR